MLKGLDNRENFFTADYYMDAVSGIFVLFSAKCKCNE